MVGVLLPNTILIDAALYHLDDIPWCCATASTTVRCVRFQVCMIQRCIKFILLATSSGCVASCEEHDVARELPLLLNGAFHRGKSVSSANECICATEGFSYGLFLRFAFAARRDAVVE